MSVLERALAFLVIALFGVGGVACAHPAQVPGGTLTVSREASPEGAPDEAKTVKIEYALSNEAIDKDFKKTMKDGFAKKGLKVDETIDARAHFDVKDAKITGTVTYVKKGMGHYSILEAELQAVGHYDADVSVDVDVATKGDTTKASEEDWSKTAAGGKPFELAKNIMPSNIPIAGPLFLHVHFDLTAACALDVEGQMHASAGVGVRGDVRMAAKYKKEGFVKEDGKKTRFQFNADAPNFELAPKPYVTVTGKQQHVRGRCSLQPTAVLLLEHSVGAKLSVEPFLQLDAQRPTPRAAWKLDAQAGVTVHAATDLEIFGRQIGKPLEFKLAELMLTKPGDELGTAPPPREGRDAPAPPSGGGRPSARDDRESAVASNSPIAPRTRALATRAAPRINLPWRKKR